MPPDLGRQEQEPQTRRGQRRVPHRSDFSAFLAIEQLQPAVQVVGQHRDLEPAPKPKLSEPPPFDFATLNWPTSIL
jgi:hypothetical protein